MCLCQSLQAAHRACLHAVSGGSDLLCCAPVQLMQQVECMFESESARGEAPEASTLAERLVQQGYSVTVRTALGGGGGCECLRNLRHVFVCVRLQACSFTHP